MLRSMFILCMFLVLFGYSREAGRLLRGVFGFCAFLWIARIVLYSGLHLLPLILLMILFGNVVLPFIRGFMSRFR